MGRKEEQSVEKEEIWGSNEGSRVTEKGRERGCRGKDERDVLAPNKI